MKKNLWTFVKKCVAIVLVVGMASQCVTGMRVNAETHPEQESAGSGIKYVEYSHSDYSEIFGETAPKASSTGDSQNVGYLFAGWFARETSSSGGTTTYTYTPVSDRPDGTPKLYAKFVPAYLMSVRGQLIAGTNSDSPTGEFRILSAVDSLNYQKVGYNIQSITLDSKTNCFKKGGTLKTAEMTKVYTAFREYSSDGATYDDVTPQSAFGSAAKYLMAHKIYNIANRHFDKITCVQPFWVTLDGTTVEGLARYIHIEDGYEHTENGTKYNYLNVPVNIRAEQGATVAGILSMDYPASTGLTFEYMEVEGGRVFEEMDWVDKTTQVRIVGNRKEIMENFEGNDVFANVRFKYTGELPDSFVVTIVNEEFGNSSEVKIENYDVWSIKTK